MTLTLRRFKTSILRSIPLILLYFLSVTEIDTEFSNLFEILSFNLQLIIIYYWMLKLPSIVGNGHIFFVGIINDVIMSLPLGTSALGYLLASFIASYIRNVTVNQSLFTEWFTFLIAIFFSNFSYYLIISNFTGMEVTYIDLF